MHAWMSMCGFDKSNCISLYQHLCCANSSKTFCIVDSRRPHGSRDLSRALGALLVKRWRCCSGAPWAEILLKQYDKLLSPCPRKKDLRKRLAACQIANRVLTSTTRWSVVVLVEASANMAVRYQVGFMRWKLLLIFFFAIEFCTAVWYLLFGIRMYISVCHVYS